MSHSQTKPLCKGFVRRNKENKKEGGVEWLRLRFPFLSRAITNGLTPFFLIFLLSSNQNLARPFRKRRRSADSCRFGLAM
jgi:hypothetical protein